MNDFEQIKFYSQVIKNLRNSGRLVKSNTIVAWPMVFKNKFEKFRKS